MVAVYSFWSKPYKKFGGGFSNDRHLLCSLAFSVLNAKKYFSSVVMYCSKDMVNVFSKLKIFDEIIPFFDEIDQVPEKHWAVSKMLVYSVQKRPFLHIDNDVYMLKPPPPHVFTARFMAQSVENAEDFAHNYHPQIEAVDRQHKYPKYWVKDWTVQHELLKTPYAHNAGVMGGTAVDHIREYARTGIDYMLELGDRLPDINTTIEQAYFAMYAFKNDLKVKGYIRKWDDREQAREVGFRHFWGGTKRGIDPGTHLPYMDGVIKKLREMKPEIYPVINKLNIKFNNLSFA